MSDIQKPKQQANGASPKPKPQATKNNLNTSNDGFKAVGKPRNNNQNGTANGSGNNQKGQNNKPKNNVNGQQKRRKEGGNNTNGNTKPKQTGNPQQAPSNPSLKGKISAEHYELVAQVTQGTGGYFSEQEAFATLQANNLSVKTAVEVLNKKKGSNWSAIVRGGLPTEQPVQQQQPVAAAKPAQSRPNQKKKAENNQANGTHEVEKVDPVAKEQDLLRDIEDNLGEWAKLKNALDSVREGDLQANLNKLVGERTTLKTRQAELEQELKTVKATLVTVESDINKLEKEKIQRLKSLEEERARLMAKAKK